MKALSRGAALLAAASSAFAMPGAMRIGDQFLAAASCGVRHTLWIEHYAAVLYLPGRAKAADALIDPARPKALRMRIINPRLMPREIPPKWRAPMARHLDAQELERARRLYRTLRRGDQLTLAYQPGEGVTLRINRRLVGAAPGHGLIEAILKTWADGEPLRPKLGQVVARNRCGPDDTAAGSGVAKTADEAGTAFAGVIPPS